MLRAVCKKLCKKTGWGLPALLLLILVYSTPLLWAQEASKEASDSLSGKVEKDNAIPVIQGLIKQNQSLLDQIRTWPSRPAMGNGQSISLSDVVQSIQSQPVDALALSAGDPRMASFKALFDAKLIDQKAFDKIRQQKAILGAMQLYNQVIEAYLTQQLAYEDMQLKIKDLELTEKQFEIGKVTNLDVLKAKKTLLDKYQQFSKAQSAYKTLSATLLETMGRPQPEGNRLVIPTDINVIAEANSGLNFSWDIPTWLAQLVRDPPADSADVLVKTAKQHRPESGAIVLLEKKSRGRFVSKKKKTFRKQLAERLNAALEGAVMRAYETWTFSTRTLEKARESLSFSDTALKQTEMTYQAGISSYKDLLEARLGRATAQAQNIEAMTNLYFSRLQLQYETGELDIPSL